jgi:hypothetical protein
MDVLDAAASAAAAKRARGGGGGKQHACLTCTTSDYISTLAIRAKMFTLRVSFTRQVAHRSEVRQKSQAASSTAASIAIVPTVTNGLHFGRDARILCIIAGGCRQNVCD